jgi:FMN-dependent NADH-azoreductase
MIIELEESDALVNRMVASDIYVIGIPMHNFSIPSIFKAFIDNIVRINRTFKMIDAKVEGLLLNKKVFVINTRGADFNDDHIAHMDHLKPFLKTILNFIGINDLTFIDVSPVQFSQPENCANAIKKGKEDIIQTIQLLDIK